jgi:tRNA (cmo5U34)-methyltransferase
MTRDKIFSRNSDLVESFRFDDDIAEVFSDMIQRSVPGYGTMISLIGIAADRYIRPNTKAYDLGCSLGASTIAIAKGRELSDFQITAVDNSKAMIERAQSNLSNISTPIELICDDVRAIKIENASLVVLNLTLQFLPREDRLLLLTQIANGLIDGGVLILSEKVCFDDPEREALMTELYYDFKRANGYSELEIAQKRNALENVMVLDTFEQHIERLRSAGFNSAERWFQAMNFTSILAVK